MYDWILNVQALSSVGFSFYLSSLYLLYFNFNKLDVLSLTTKTRMICIYKFRNPDRLHSSSTTFGRVMNSVPEISLWLILEINCLVYNQ